MGRRGRKREGKEEEEGEEKREEEEEEERGESRGGKEGEEENERVLAPGCLHYMEQLDQLSPLNTQFRLHARGYIYTTL